MRFNKNIGNGTSDSPLSRNDVAGRIVYILPTTTHNSHVAARDFITPS